MRNNFKLALVPLALASAFATNSAMASEACIEVYDGSQTATVGSYLFADGVTVFNAPGTNFNGVEGFEVRYIPVNCASQMAPAPDAATATELKNFDPLKVARELTKSVTIDLADPADPTQFALNSSVLDNEFTTNIVYTPTSVIPGGTRLSFDLANGVWEDAQLNLLAINDELIVNNSSVYLAVVATTDGGRIIGTGPDGNGVPVGTTRFEFLVPSGITIAAGTRLAVSSETLNVEPPVVSFSNDSCGGSAPVQLSVPIAFNDIGGADRITGGQTDGAVTVIDGSQPQFASFVGQEFVAAVGLAEETQFDGTDNAVVDAEVDALLPSLRTQFVTEISTGTAGGAIVLDDASSTTVQFASSFLNRLVVAGSNSIDLGVSLSASDQVEVWPYIEDGSLISSNVQLQLFDTANEGGVVSDTFSDQYAFDVDASNTSYIYNDSSVAIPRNVGEAQYGVNALQLFDNTEADHSSVTGNPVYWVLTQTDTDEVILPSAFDVRLTHYVDFADDDLLDQCVGDFFAYEINTNGAQLKVPYHFEANGNWIRVTNEFNQEAVIIMDIQGEVGTDVESDSYVTNVELDQMVPPNGSVLLFVPDLVAQAEDDGYNAGGTAGTGQDQRHTITLTVSAPRDDVHGVAVQKVDGQDRVVPVLDKNEWQQ